MAKPIELGDVFHRWTVIGFDANPLYVKCRCGCEHKTERLVNKKNLKAGGSKSCGCWIVEHKKTHGMSGTRTYKLWQSMQTRVKLNVHYHQKGIGICERWCGPDGFVNFLADMGECPADKKSLDRYPDPNGNYEPGNCRWATDSEQQRNKSTTKFYTFVNKQGVEQTWPLSAWAEEYELALTTLQARLERGWSIEKACTTPQGIRRGRGSSQTPNRVIEYRGRSQTLAEWAAEFGLTLSTMIERVWSKWSMDRIASTPQGHRGGYSKALMRRAATVADPTLVEDGDTFLKYLSAMEAREILHRLIDQSKTRDLNTLMNLIYGGGSPKFKLLGVPANAFAVHPDEVASVPVEQPHAAG